MVRWVSLADAAPVVPSFGRACLPSSIVGFFHGAFQPHLDEMQHAPVEQSGALPTFLARHGGCFRSSPRGRRQRLPGGLGVATLPPRPPPVGRAPGAVGILLWWKVGFEDRFQHQHRCCHADPIPQGRDAQRPEFAVGFRYEHSSDGSRSISLLPERKRQFAEPSLHPIHLDIRELLTIHARCALVGAALGIGVNRMSSRLILSYKA